MLHALASLPRRLRWAFRSWSSAADREFHDALFSVQRYDPFSFAYPGYVTIRRFAELTEPHLAGARHAVDFGCGPGEITCELARHHPDIRFTGVDHSEAAIARARQHKDTLKLGNVDFICADVSSFTPEMVDVALLYDSFHHLLDPAGFVRRLAPRVERFVLVEPAGDWLGGWQKTVELDWIPSAVDAIRARLAWQMNVEDVPPRAAGEGAEARGEPIEHRYTIADLQHFFDGYGLDVRGTIAGIDEYPPDPYSALPLREAFGRIAFHTLRDIEELLVSQDLDLHAKHWLVHARRGAPHRLRTPRPVNPRSGEPDRRPAGQYDVEYVSVHPPAAAPAGAVFPVEVTLKNNGWRPWRSEGETPVLASYHWLAADGTMAIEDGLRTPLPRPLEPGEMLTMTCTVAAPGQPGAYVLAIDLVEEGVTWFSRAGAPLQRSRVRVS